MPKSIADNKNVDRDNPEMEESTGNVFLDLGFPSDEAVNLLVRCDLAYKIQTLIKARGWTQAEAADFLSVRQPRISDLMNNRIEKFTIDMLMKWLIKLGKKVKVVVLD